MLISNHKDASIYLKDGVLIVDFIKVEKTSIHTKIYKYIDGNVLYITSEKLNYKFFNTSSFAEYNCYDEKYFDLVKPEYLEEEIITSRKWFFGKKINKSFKQIKKGWVELKDTGIPVSYITSTYLIIE